MRVSQHRVVEAIEPQAGGVDIVGLGVPPDRRGRGCETAKQVTLPRNQRNSLTAFRAAKH